MRAGPTGSPGGAVRSTWCSACCASSGSDYRTTRDPRLWVAERCPACGVDGYPLWIVEDDDDRRSNRVLLSCFNGCAQHAVLEALAGEPS